MVTLHRNYTSVSMIRSESNGHDATGPGGYDTDGGTLMPDGHGGFIINRPASAQVVPVQLPDTCCEIIRVGDSFFGRDGSLNFCTGKVYARGRCTKHYWQLQRGEKGNLRLRYRKGRRLRRRCPVKGCEQLTDAYIEMCNRHWRRRNTRGKDADVSVDGRRSTPEQKMELRRQRRDRENERKRNVRQLATAAREASAQMETAS